jgi:hypothetical protein
MANGLRVTSFVPGSKLAEAKQGLKRSWLAGNIDSKHDSAAST